MKSEWEIREYNGIRLYVRGPKDDRPHWVYRLFDSAGELLYVGCTTQPDARLKAHKAKPWWPDVASVTWVEYPFKVPASNAEYWAIRNENPRHNWVGTLGHQEQAREIARRRWELKRAAGA